MDYLSSSSGRDSKHNLFSMGSSLSSSSSSSKRQRSIVTHEEINIIVDEKPLSAVNTSDDIKNKLPMVHGVDMQEQDYLDNEVSTSTNHDLEMNASVDAVKGSEQDSLDDVYIDDCEEDYYDQDDDDEYEYDNDLIDNDCDYTLAAKLEDMDLPPGVEAVVPWVLREPEDLSSNYKQIEQLDVETDKKFQLFKQFDTTEDYSDHFYANAKVHEPSRDWRKKIHQEWKVLERDLPDTIYVRVYEDRMDLLRAVIIGPSGTPYHDGLFFFDFQFSSQYPDSPPTAHYHSGGHRINPNLYNCGKVCLSLLNTWSGQGCEKWDPKHSTMLQVLVSIQALVLNAEPFYNEPGYTRLANTSSGRAKSVAYNQDVFLISCKTMLYSLRKPPKPFEDFVAGHFRKRGHTILAACRAYMNGAQVGHPTGAENSNAVSGGNPASFCEALGRLFEDLLMEFTVKGADCKKFLDQKIKAGAASAVNATSTEL